MASEADDRTRASDPSADPDWLAEVVRTRHLWPEVRARALSNPSLPTEVLREFLCKGLTDAWLNPAVPLLLLVDTSADLLRGAATCARTNYPLPHDSPLRDALVIHVQAWWEQARGERMAQSLGVIVERDGRLGSHLHRRVCGLALRWVEEANVLGRGWNEDALGRLDLVRRWLGGEAIGIEVLAAAAEEATEQAKHYDPEFVEEAVDETEYAAYLALATLLDAVTFDDPEVAFGDTAHNAALTWGAERAWAMTRIELQIRVAFPVCPWLERKG